MVPGRYRTAEQQRGALTVAGGRVYVPFGGLDGDCGNYVGYVAAPRTDGTGTVAVSQPPPTLRHVTVGAAPSTVTDAPALRIRIKKSLIHVPGTSTT